jgi:hypothetical protein
VAGLYLAWWVVRIAAVDAEVEDNPFLAARADPDHPRVRIELAMAEFYLRQGRVSGPTEAAAIQAMARAPLADEPFLLAGVAALAQGDAARGQALLTEARRRNPRLRLARLLLLDRYLREKRLAEAAGEMAALNRLISGADIVLIPALAKLTQDPTTSAELIPILQRQPHLREPVLEQLAASGADPDLILKIAQGSLASEAGQPWQRSLVTGLIAKGAFDRALQIWRTIAGAEPGDGGKGLYDDQFLGRLGPPPFNWDLSTGAAGVAERVRGGLQVDYYGRDDGDLASQLLMLPPGGYRLRFGAEGDAKGESSRLAWRISCASARDNLFELPVVNVSTSPKIFTGTFTVPAGCAAQWLKLHGIPGDVPGEQNVKISDLSLVREAAR